ncbi:MAG: hypothetical protein ABEH83_11315, partial [Halobacterium sp.]
TATSPNRVGDPAADMDELVTILREQEQGPVHIVVDGEWEHDVELEDAEIGEQGFHAEGRDLEADNVLFEFETPKTSDERVTVKRRHARDDEWEELGELTEVDVETHIG